MSLAKSIIQRGAPSSVMKPSCVHPGAPATPRPAASRAVPRRDLLAGVLSLGALVQARTLLPPLLGSCGGGEPS